MLPSQLEGAPAAPNFYLTLDATMQSQSEGLSPVNAHKRLPEAMPEPAGSAEENEEGFHDAGTERDEERKEQGLGEEVGDRNATKDGGMMIPIPATLWETQALNLDDEDGEDEKSLGRSNEEEEEQEVKRDKTPETCGGRLSDVVPPDTMSPQEERLFQGKEKLSSAQRSLKNRNKIGEDEEEEEEGAVPETLSPMANIEESDNEDDANLETKEEAKTSPSLIIPETYFQQNDVSSEEGKEEDGVSSMNEKQQTQATTQRTTLSRYFETPDTDESEMKEEGQTQTTRIPSTIEPISRTFEANGNENVNDEEEEGEREKEVLTKETNEPARFPRIPPTLWESQDLNLSDSDSEDEGILKKGGIRKAGSSFSEEEVTQDSKKTIEPECFKDEDQEQEGHTSTKGPVVIDSQDSDEDLDEMLLRSPRRDKKPVSEDFFESEFEKGHEQVEKPQEQKYDSRKAVFKAERKLSSSSTTSKRRVRLFSDDEDKESEIDEDEVEFIHSSELNIEKPKRTVKKRRVPESVAQSEVTLQACRGKITFFFPKRANEDEDEDERGKELKESPRF